MKNKNISKIMMLREDERPYEKCESKGPGALTEVELLSIILRTGSEGISVLDTARDLIDSFEPYGIAGLASATKSELMKVRGIGRVKALQLLSIAELSRRLVKAGRGAAPVFTNSDQVAAYYMEDFRHERQEKVLVVMLDTKGKLLGQEVISKGTVNGSFASPREIFLAALDRKAVSIILIHNHPSGDPEPSEEDYGLTLRVRDAGLMLGIPLLDHIIIGDRRAVSLYPVIKEENLPDREEPAAGRSGYTARGTGPEDFDSAAER